MRTKAKANSVITHELRTVEEGSQLVFKVKDAGETTLDLWKVHSGVKERAMLHGLIQRVSDRAAISRNTETGKSATAGEKLNAMAMLVQHYNAGNEAWNLAGTGGGPSAEFTLLLDALCEVYAAKPREELGKWLKARSASERASLMESKQLKPIVERLRAQSAKGVDVDELLSGLEDESSEGEETEQQETEGEETEE